MMTNENGMTLLIDGQLKSDLDWKQALAVAKAAAEEGKKLFWQLDLGLFDRLVFPLSNQSQYLSLGLSIEHFRDDIWKTFPEQTVGVCIYRGSADFTSGFPWDDDQIANLQGWLQDVFGTLELFTAETGISAVSFQEIDHRFLRQTVVGDQLVRLFCRDAAAEYLELLTNRLPDELQLYLELDASDIYSRLDQAQLLSKERFERFHLIVNGSLLPAAAQHVKVAVCLPQMALSRPSHYAGMGTALDLLASKRIPYKIIPEPHIITEWDGLDYLIVSPAGLSSQGMRKLQGFCAAGGTVVTLGATVGVPHEELFADWITQWNQQGIGNQNTFLNFP